MSPALSRAVQTIALWLCIAAAAIAIVVRWDDVSAALAVEQDVSTPLQNSPAFPRSEPMDSNLVEPPGAEVAIEAGRGGHYQAQAWIDGAGVNVMVDTGASSVALAWEDAERIGMALHPGDFTLAMNTANGVAYAAPVQIPSVRIGGITVYDVPGVVMPRGRLRTSLLGMSFLSRLKRFEVSRGRLVLEQ
jgi:aspartyl protease family protein